MAPMPSPSGMTRSRRTTSGDSAWRRRESASSAPASLADDLNTLLEAEKGTQAFAHHRVVVDDDEADRRRHVCAERHA